MAKKVARVFGGTGLGIAFFLWLAHRGGDARVIAATARTVVIADACFTAPAVITQFATGLWLVHTLGLPYSQLWIALALVLFGFVGLCWLPVLWLQWRARRLAGTRTCRFQRPGGRGGEGEREHRA